MAKREANEVRKAFEALRRVYQISVRCVQGWLPGRAEAWPNIQEEIEWRSRLLKSAYESLGQLGKPVTDKLDVVVRFKLAATDVFVEKAQARLTTRAWNLTFAAILCGTLALGVLTFGFELVWGKSPADMMVGLGELNGYKLTVVLARMVTLGGLIGGAVYFLGALAKSFMHEAMVLYNRRHAIRLGRLYVYLKLAEVKSEEIEKMFHWNDEFSSAFQKIDPESIKGLGAAGLTVEVIKALGEMNKNMSPWAWWPHAGPGSGGSSPPLQPPPPPPNSATPLPPVVPK